MKDAPHDHAQRIPLAHGANRSAAARLNGEHQYQLEVIVRALEHEVGLLNLRLDHIDATLDLLLRHLGVPTQSYVIREDRERGVKSLTPK